MRRATDRWLERWMASVSDLSQLRADHPMLDAVIDEQVGRRVRIGEQWLVDFASSNYLGFDLDAEIAAAVSDQLSRWGTHPGWPRLVGSPAPYAELEARLADLLVCEDTLLMPTATQVHASVIPVLAGDGVIFLDGRAHKTAYDGAMIARSHGATIQRFRHHDQEHLEEMLRSCPIGPRIIVVDGVNAVTGNAPDIRAFARLAREHDALLYLDDAHGFGVMGERGADELCEWGKRGNGVVRHQGESYEGIVVVAGFSAAYSATLAFIALPSKMKDTLKVAAPPYLYSGPPSIASLATAIAGLDANERRGELHRYEAYRKTARVLERLHELEVHTPNRSSHPVIAVPLANPNDLDAAGRFLFERSIFTMLATYPLVPKDEVGFRIQVTAANSDDEIDHLCDVLEELTDRFELQRKSRHELLRGPASS
jgi:8-amino-7-oxononanoate synthase